MKFSYTVQEEPRGIAQALILGEEFLRGHPSALVLGDNVIFVDGLQSRLIKANQRSAGATVFACDVANLQNYGVIEFGIDERPASIKEKPSEPLSNFAMPGIYFFDHTTTERASSLNFSQRGELEIADLSAIAMQNGWL